MTNGVDNSPGGVIKRMAHRAGIARWVAVRASRARILMFHGIGDERHSTAVFERQVAYLSRHFNVVSIDRLLEMLAAGEPFGNEVVLTFDDGLRNNVQQAVPVLLRNHAPATFYVCPGLIETGTWLWNQEARARLRTLPADRRARLAGEWGVDDGIESVIAWMKSLPRDSREEVEERLRRETVNFNATPADRVRCDVMSWDELCGLDSNLVTVGAHTTNHVIAKGLASEDLQREIVDCRRVLEDKLQRPVHHFCYPNGDYDEATLGKVKQTYASAVTTREGMVANGDDRFLLNRIPSANSLEYQSWRLMRPGS